MGLTYHLQKKVSRKSATSQLGIPPCANKHNDEVNADLSTKHVELRITTGGYNLYKGGIESIPERSPNFPLQISSYQVYPTTSNACRERGREPAYRPT